MQIRKGHHPEKGFNLLELLVVLAVAGIVLVTVFRFFDNWRPVFQLESATRRASALIARARLEALRRNTTAVIEADIVNGTFFAYADINGNSSPASPEFSSYLVFDPTDADLSERRLDDYLIGEATIPAGVFFGDPTNGIHGVDSVWKLTPRPAHADPGANLMVFDPSGRLLDIGTYRFTRLNDNHLEVAVTSVGGAVEIRKFLKMADRPTNGVDENEGFFARGNIDGNSNQIWVWY